MTKRKRERMLLRLAVVLALALGARVLALILYEYRYYFPPDFELSNFLGGRENTFKGLYRSAFYLHITTGPFAIVAGALLMFSGPRKKFKTAHRLLGRLQIMTIVLLVAPSGLVMATQAHAGPIAGFGFAALALSTAATAIMAVQNAWRGRIVEHQVWAKRCFILLCSPMLLRLMSGAMIVLDYESLMTYRVIAWISWLIPLAIFEAYCWQRRNEKSNSKISFSDSRKLSHEP